LGSLTETDDGSLLGVTSTGGAGGGSSPYAGVLFKFNPTGNVFFVLFDFERAPEGITF
jgi:hypothetical protein